MTADARATALRVASYNIHRCVGTDRRRDPRRVAQVIREIDADILGLQEVDWHAATGPGAPRRPSSWQIWRATPRSRAPICATIAASTATCC